MSEFEKWLETVDSKDCPLLIDYCCNAVRKRAWEAALDWAIGAMGDFPVSGHDSSHDRTKMIRLIKGGKK